MVEHRPAQSDLIPYRTEDGQTRIKVRLDDETVWMTQTAKAELYQTTLQKITLHPNPIYDVGELEEAATCKEYLQVQQQIINQQRLKREAQREALTDDAVLKRYLEGEK